jgi:hypothetical protein
MSIHKYLLLIVLILPTTCTQRVLDFILCLHNNYKITYLGTLRIVSNSALNHHLYRSFTLYRFVDFQDRSASVSQIHQRSRSAHFLHPVVPGQVLQVETEALQKVPGCYPGCSSKTSDGVSWIGRWLLLTFLKRMGSPLQFSLLLTKWWRECRSGRGKNKGRQLYKFSAWEPHVSYKRSWTLQLHSSNSYSFCSGRHEIPCVFPSAFTSYYDICLYKWLLLLILFYEPCTRFMKRRKWVT